MIDLTPFYNPEDRREYCRKPFELDGGTVAANGHIIIRLDELRSNIEENANREAIKTIRDLLAKAPASGYGALACTAKDDASDLHICPACYGGGKRLEKGVCPECDGDGEIEFRNDHHTYVCECKTCDGSGKTVVRVTDKLCPRCDGSGKDRRTIYCDLGDMGISLHYARLLEELPSVEIVTAPDDGICFFRFDGGRGALMGLRA